MKILFVNANMGYGGASKIMVWLCNQLALNGNTVFFLTYRDKKEYQRLDFNVTHQHLPLEENGRSFFYTINKLHQYIKEGQFDWAIAFLSPSQLRLSIACKGTRTKLLFSHRGDPYRTSVGFKGHIIRIINSWAFRQANYYVFQTEKARDFFSNKIKRRSSVIANPIKPLIRTCIREGNIEKVIVSVARLDIHQKRQDLLIKAFLKISNFYPDYKLFIYGDGEDESVLREMTVSSTKIFLKGKTDKVVDAIQNATMFVLTSDYEGIPNALLEALSLGVPCISTDCSPGGAALLINNEVNGLLVSCCDIQAIAEAISFFIENSEERERMGKEGMLVNKTFSENVIKEKWFEILKTK